MTIDTHKIRSIFLAAIENHSPDEWQTYLDAACAGDDEVRQRVEALLRGHTAYNGLLDRPVAPLGSGITEGLGSIIGPYKLMEQIGEGGMGLVFIAEQQQPVRRKVALKVIKPGMDTRQVVARFEAERQALALMDHPNIARVLDGGSTSSGRPFFVMELVKGVPITEYCDQNRLRPRDRLELFINVCQAVQHAHQRGIIHRDLKPSNVLITSHDGTPVVKVIDFGVAKSIGQQLTDKTVYTQLTQLVGTPLYMSPEQAGQSGLDVDTRTDIYALGVLLYELLTGITPLDQGRFKAAACDEIRRIIREEDPPRPSTRISTLGAETATVLTAHRQSDPKKLSQFLRGELDWIVMKCLEKDRNRRYATANGLATDLQRYLRNENVLACPPSVSYQFRKFVQRNRKPVGIAAALGLMLLLAVVQLSVSNVQIRKEQDETEKALRGVTQARTDLQDALKREHQNAYFQRIARADLEWWAFNVGRADQILDECPAEYRDWEWRYLKRLCHADLVTLPGHSREVRSIAISPDGRLLASAGDDGAMNIWSLVGGEVAGGADSALTTLHTPLTTVHGHKLPVLSVAFSPDGRQLAAVGGDWRSGQSGEAKVWDVATGAEILDLVGHQTAIGGVAFSPDGRLIATAGWDRTLRLWDSKTGKQLLKREHAGSLKCVAFSPDGKQIACGGADRVITIWNPADGQLVRTLSGHASSILSIAFSGGGQRLVSGSWDHTARIWDIASGSQLQVLRGHMNVVYSVAFSPDNSRVASACVDSSVKVWESWSGQELRTLRGHNGGVYGVVFSPGGRFLTTAGVDRTIKLWDLNADMQSRSFPWADSNRPSLAFSPDGNHLAAANRRLSTRKDPVRVRIYDSHTGQQVLALPEHPDGCHGVAYRFDGSQLVTDWGHQAKSWDAKSGREIVTLTGHSGLVTASAFAPDGDMIATASMDRTAKLWDARTGKEIGTLAGPGAAPTSIAFRPNPLKPNANSMDEGGFLATGSMDHSVRIWDLKGRRAIAELFGHRAPVTAVVFSPDGRLLASSSEDGDIRIWDVAQVFLSQTKQGAAKAKLLHVLPGRSGVVDSVAFSRDGKRLASAHEDGTVTIWDVETGQEALSLRRQMTRACCVAFSPDGRRLVASGHPMGTGFSGVTIWTAEETNKRTPSAIQQMIAQDARDGWYVKARATAASNADLAITLFSKALDLGRDDAAVRSERGTQYARKAQWSAAAADFAEATRRRPEDARLWYWLAAANLGEKNTSAYQKTRAGILERFGKTSDPGVASHLLYICVTLPSASGETAPLVRLGQIATPAFRGNERVLAAALFRHGDFQASLEQFDRSARVLKPRAWDLLFRSMAHQKLGRAGAAQECFEAALAWIERADKSAGDGNRSDWIAWHESVEVQYLREEAAALLGRAKDVKK